MKTYFAKYLPVEGEMKMGDKIFFKEDNTRGLLSEGGLPEWVINKCVEKKHKTGKLFLCSRDIRVGDELWTGRKETTLVFEDGANGRDEGNWCHLSAAISGHYFKVIGEISPEATWVVEGDEFKRDSLSAHGVGVNWNDDYGKYTFTIKGPCGHFH